MEQNKDLQQEIAETINWAYKSMQTFIKEHQKMCQDLRMDMDFKEIAQIPEDEDELNVRYSKAMDLLKSASQFAAIMQATIQRQYLLIQEEPEQQHV